jgi:hypothetical protein
MSILYVFLAKIGLTCPIACPSIEHVFDDDECLAALDRLDAALRDLAGTDFGALDEDTLAEAFRRLEAHSRRRDSAEHLLVAEIDGRGVAFSHGCRSVPAFLRALTTISPADAKRRHRAACDLAPGRTFAGEPVAPIYPQTSNAQSAGELSAAHARIITRTIETLPDVVTAEHDVEIERILVESAAVLDPRQLAVAARRLAFYYDQDGVLADEAYRDKHRHLTIAQRADGSAHVEGELTAPCAEALLSVLDSLARPVPSAAGVQDTRTAGERRHDGLLDGLNRLLRDGGLPETGGVHATVLLTISEAQLRDAAGLVTTGHGALLSLQQALQIATDAEIVPIVFGAAKQIAAYGSAHRIAKPSQRLALAARDSGCSFPGCDHPPSWTETHHVREFQHGGSTSIDNLTLVCGYHHREHQKLGWTCAMIDGRPHWTPPPWIDRTRTPRLNTARR